MFAILVAAAILGAWFLGNFLYDYVWAELDAGGVKQADVIAYTIAHGGSFVLALAIFAAAIALLHREHSAGRLAIPIAVPDNVPAGGASDIDARILLRDAARRTYEQAQELTLGMIVDADSADPEDRLELLMRGIVRRRYQLMGLSPPSTSLPRIITATEQNTLIPINGTSNLRWQGRRGLEAPAFVDVTIAESDLQDHIDQIKRAERDAEQSAARAGDVNLNGGIGGITITGGPGGSHGDGGAVIIKGGDA